MYKQNELRSTSEIYIAIDWAEEKHAVAINVDGVIRNFEVNNDCKAIKIFFLTLKENVQCERVTVVIENNSNMIMTILDGLDYVELYVVHPTTAAAYREAFIPSGAKADPSDAASLLDLLLKHPEHVKKYQSPEKTDLLGIYTEKRRDAVARRTALGNKLIAVLKKSSPVRLKIFNQSSVHAPIVLGFLEKWPTMSDLKTSTENRIKRYLNSKSSKPSKTPTRIDLIRQSEVFLDKELEELYKLETVTLVQEIRTLNDVIKQYEAKIKIIYIQNEDYEIFSTLPGSGDAMGPRLLAFFGNDRNKFKTVEEALLISEIAPVTVQSGKQRSIRRRYLCNKFIQQTFVEYADGSLKKSRWAKAYYDQQTSKGKTHFTALRNLAYKWIRVIYACWKKCKRYDESKYIQQLIRKRSPLVNNLGIAS